VNTAEKQLLRSTLDGLGRRVLEFGLLGLVTTAFLQAGPLLIAWAVDHVGAHNAVRDLTLGAAAYLAVNLIGAWLSAVHIRLGSRLSEASVLRIRERLFGHVLTQDARFFERSSDGALISRLTSDVEIIAIFLRNGLVMATINVFVLVVTMVFLIVLSPLLAGIVLCIVVPLWALSARAFSARAHAANDALRAGVADATAELAEGIHGIAVTRRFGRGADQTARYVQRNRVRLSAAAEAQRLAAIYSSSVDLIGVLVYIPVILGGAVLLRQHLIGLGAIAGFVVYMGSFFDPVQSLTQILAQGQGARSAFNRSAELLAIPAPPAPVVTRSLPAAGEIALEDVTFSYNEDAAPVLAGFDLRIAAGERIALVGPSGAGKTTVARLLSRTLLPQHGHVRFAGVDLRDVAWQTLRSRIVTVSQERHLFTGSLRANLRVASDDELRIEQMIDLLAGFGVDSLPESGRQARDRVRLSAGQRQLVGLARALLLDPAVLILDEVTADVDEETAAAVDQLLRDQPADRTVIVVAHRMETARRMDRVVSIRHGRIVGDGGNVAGSPPAHSVLDHLH
jgi:ATP-binding cassette, subfamily B, bacterial